MKNVLVYGASGHSKMIVDIINMDEGLTMKGYIDSYKPLNQEVYGYKILGDLNNLLHIIEKFNIHAIVLGIGNNDTRLVVYKKIIKVAPELSFISVIHPSAILANDVIIPEGTVVMAAAVVNADAKVGKFCILNTKSSLGHDSTMGDFSSLASGVTISGTVTIGFCAEICLSASIAQNISIGKHTTVGGSSLVLKSIGDNKLAYGVPIHTIEEKVISKTQYD